MATAAALLVGLAPLLWPAWYADYMPLAGVERLNESGVYGTVYCHHMAGGLIADTGSPDRRPTHDGRFYAPPPEGWDGYLRAGAGEASVEAIEAAYRPAAILLHPAAQGGLVARLRDHPDWREVYADRNSVLFLPR